MRKLIPSSRAGQFFFFAAETYVAYFILVANTRAFTQGSYLWTAITDTLFTAQTFIVAKLMIDDKDARSWFAMAGSTIGGTLGSLSAIWVTKHLFGH